MPAEDLAPAIELFRERFLHALRDTKHISPRKLADLLSWKHSGFHIHDGGEKPDPSICPLGGRSLGEGPCCKGSMKPVRKFIRREEIPLGDGRILVLDDT